MSDLWLGALRSKMGSVVHDRDEGRRADARAGATVGKAAAREIDAPGSAPGDVSAPSSAFGAMQANSGEHAR